VKFSEFLKELSKLGPIGCWCCPGDLSNRTSSCITWRVLQAKKNRSDDRHRGAAGRYPVSEMFPCPICGRIPFHVHREEELARNKVSKKE
jgi:hypothetical protein